MPIYDISLPLKAKQNKQHIVISLKINPMAKYSEKSQEKVQEAMHEMKEGKLKTGTGKKVTNPKQAVAIGLSEAREEGAKVPKKK